MKILWFSNTPANGEEVLEESSGRGGWLSSLDKALNGKVELSVAFYYARYTGVFKHKGVTYYPICKKNWRLNIIHSNIFGVFRDQEDLPEYLNIIQIVQPDVIHIHGSENPFGCIIGNTSVPVVLSIQGICTVYTHKYYSGIPKQFATTSNLRLLAPLSWIFSKSFNFQYRHIFKRYPTIEQRNLRNCRYIIGRTDWDRRVSRILAPESNYFHNDEVLRESFYHTIWARPKNTTLIVHSTIGEGLYKGLETILQTINVLNAYGISVEWNIAGVSYHGLLNKTVRRMIGKTYPVNGPRFLGNLNERELIQVMLKAHVYVMPSHIENSPNSLCEAMILGMPCITTLAGGTPSLLKDKEEGLVIQDGDPWSLAGALLEFLQNPEVACKYGENARITALARHDSETIVKDLLAIYNSIILHLD